MKSGYEGLGLKPGRLTGQDMTVPKNSVVVGIRCI
jgi:hypothetical protein